MKSIYAEHILGRLDDAVLAVILSDTTPESLELTGADVDGLDDEDIIAAGSVLITPDANYIAFEDGVFMAKSGSGGGGGGGSDGGALKVAFWYDGGEEAYACDKTYDEIASAYQAGKYIWGFKDYDSQLTGNGEALNLDSVSFSEDVMASVFYFARYGVYEDGVTAEAFAVYPSGLVEHYEMQYPSASY